MRSNSDLGKIPFLRKYLTFFIVLFSFQPSFGNNIAEINKSGEIEFFNIEKIETPILNESYFHSLCLNFDKNLRHN